MPRPYHSLKSPLCSFQQEFMCLPADDNTAFLPYDLIASCEYNQGEQWETDLQDCKNPLYVGVDIGRERDLTVIWLVESVNGVHFTRRIIELHRQTFDAQECALYELLKLRMVRRCCIDRSGLGRQFAERAQKKFGPYRVEGVDFTQGSKEELAYPVRLAFEDRAVRVPFSNAIRSDLRGVRKLVTTSGNTRFAGQRNAYGHCDRFWALAIGAPCCKATSKRSYHGRVIKTDPGWIWQQSDWAKDAVVYPAHIRSRRVPRVFREVGA